MDWKAVFNDIHQWMSLSNQMSQRHAITSDEYWVWLIHSLGEIEVKYNRHPLVVGMLSAVIKFQDDNYKQVMGR